MKLWHTKTVWEKLAREDPYWAVLTVPDKAGNRWQPGEFFETGVADVAADMDYLGEHLPELRRGRALDFGCGVGRLTQALARHFEHVTGLDVAEPMIERAREHNEQGDRVNYVHNPASDLRQFDDDQFDLVYSVITLQHIPVALTRGYLREFVRVCRPGGALLFQMTATVPLSHARFSWYPPTIWKRLKRGFLRVTGLKAQMSMNALSKSEVIDCLGKAGANVVKVRPYHAAGELESWLYLAVKS